MQRLLRCRSAVTRAHRPYRTIMCRSRLTVVLFSLTNGLLYAAKNCHGKREAALPVHRPHHDVQIASRLGADPEPCGCCHSLPVLAPALREIVCSSSMRTCLDRRPSPIPTPITGDSERRTRSTGTLYETWVLTRYDDVVWALRHPEVFSSEIFLRDPHPPLPPILETDQALYEFNKHYFAIGSSRRDALTISGCGGWSTRISIPGTSPGDSARWCRR